MADRIWRGDAPAVCQVTHVRFLNVEVGDVFGLKINNKTIQATAATDAASDVVDKFITAITDSADPEWGELIASTEPDEVGADVLILTASQCGRPFVVEIDADVTSLEQIDVQEITKGQAGQNEIQKIEFVKPPTGGTFAITWDPPGPGGPETTGPISYDATFIEVKNALEGLASINPGDVRVNGGPGPGVPWFVQFTGQYAETDVALLDVDGANLQGAAECEVTTVTEGADASDEIHAFKFLFPGIDLSYKLKYLGEWTQPINTATNPQSAIEALKSVGQGNVEVVGDYVSQPDEYGTDSIKGVWIIHFKGNLSGQRVSPPAVDLTGSGGSADVDVLQPGGESEWPEWQWMKLVGGAPTFRVFYDGEWSDDILFEDWQNGLTSVAEELNGLSTVDFGIIEHDYFGFAEKLPFVVLEMLGNTDREQAVINPAPGSGVGDGFGTLLDGGSGGGTNEVQEVTVFASGGTFTLTFDGETTSAIDFGAPANSTQSGGDGSSVEEKLEALSNITDVDVTGSGTPDDPYRVTFVDPGQQNVPQMTCDETNLTGGDARVTVVQKAVASVNEQQTITLEPEVGGGTFTLTFKGETTSGIAFDATAGDVETALEALTTIDGVTVTGSAGGPWTVTFDTGNVAGRDVPLLEADGTNLTGGSVSQSITVTEETRSAGEHHWDDPLNWAGTPGSGTGLRVPETGDTVWIDGGPPILYGLRQSTTFTADSSTDRLSMSDLADFREGQKVRVSSDQTLPGGLSAGTDYYVLNLDRDNQTLQLSATEGGPAVDVTDAGTGVHTVRVELTSLNVTDKFTEQIGLPAINEDGDYYEYRERALHVGLDPDGAKEVIVGGPEGSGPGLARFDFAGSEVRTFRIRSTGGSIEPGRPAVTAVGDSLTKITVITGHFGLAVFPAETATVGELIVRGGEVEVGKGVNLTTLDKTGGLLQVDEATLNGTAVIE